MDKLKTYFSTKTSEFVNHLKKNKIKILTLYLTLIIAFIIVYAIDQVTKQVLFNHGDVFKMNGNGQVEFNGRWINPETPTSPIEYWNGFFGTRSIWHKGVTFVETHGNVFWIQVISFIIIAIILLLPLFVTGKYAYAYIVGFGFLLAGDLGNATDRIVFNGYVKDVFFIPWHDRGTFNFADVLIFFSIGYLFMIYLIYFVDSYLTEKHKKQQDKLKASETSSTNDNNDK
ncbi:signal peptidase II [Mycoplasma sp. Pen4]|uniref:signal peptidase II n=1 Tax=Mycoplasma sp. Pen4 TaxID=640330 RepID=UPI0016547AA0|nr:signal peptidase II [Mycoplasma sp. Pen4]QNM93396.1 signal peptidase II [Mycoplasma sp. Pen4]